MKLAYRLVLLLVLAAVVLSACGVAGRNALLGKWKSNDPTQDVSMEFTMDGRMRIGSQGAIQEYVYQFVDDTTIALKASQGEQKISFTVAGDKMTLDVGQGEKLDFDRVK